MRAAKSDTRHKSAFRHSKAGTIPVASLILLSAGSLAYEIILMRLFSIIHWHHFAYMMISVALLGYGASGTFVFLFKHYLLSRYRSAYLFSGTAFAVTSLGSFLLAEQIPFNTLAFFWDASQWWQLLKIYLLLFVPFFFAANAIAITLCHFSDVIPRIYGLNLLGAGVGSLMVILLLYLLPPAQLLKWLAITLILAMSVASLEIRHPLLAPLGPFRVLSVQLIMLLALLAIPDEILDLKLSEYKAEVQFKTLPGAEVLETMSSPLGRLTAVKSQQIPLRVVQGSSIYMPDEPPDQIGIFTDGDGMTVINRFAGRREELRFLDYQTQALPYYLNKNPLTNEPISGEPLNNQPLNNQPLNSEPIKGGLEVLVIGAGGGSDLLLANYHQARHVDGIEINRQMVELFEERFAPFSGWPFLKAHTRIHVMDARGFLSHSSKPYDIIQIPLTDSAAASLAGALSLAENYLYTLEALQSYWNSLRPQGYLTITRWLKLPPRDSFKLTLMTAEMLRQAGIDNPAAHLVAIRSWKTVSLLVAKRPLGNDEIAALKTFSERRGFDLIYYPGIRPEEANRFNQLRTPLFYEGVRDILADSAGFIERYKFNLKPATDNRPYFNHFFKWSAFGELLALREQGSMALVDAAYPVLVAALFQAVFVSGLLILLPLLTSQSSPGKNPSSPLSKVRLLLYFSALGFAYFFIEIAFIQKFILFLQHPTLSVTTVVAAFLIFSGLGSLYANRIKADRRNLYWRAVRRSIMAIAALGSLYLVAGAALLNSLMGLTEGLKIAMTLLLIAPLAFVMGMPFSLGLAQVSHHHASFTPWAWGINGCASVIGSILATLLAIHFGFNAVLMIALLLYGLSTFLNLNP